MNEFVAKRVLQRPRRRLRRPAGLMGTITLTTEQVIADAAARCRNWGRWGAGRRPRHAELHRRRQTRRGRRAGPPRGAFSLSQSFDTDGPQKGWRRRTNPVHTMTDTGTDAAARQPGLPARLRRRRRRHRHAAAVLAPSGTASGTSSTTARPGTAAAPGDVVTARRPGHRHRAPRPSSSCPRRPARRRPASIGERRRTARRFRHHRGAPRGHHRRAGRRRRGRPRRHRAGAHRTADPRPPRRLGRLRRRRRPRAVASPPPAGCTAPRSPRSPPTPGASRCGPTSSPTPSSRCIRSPSRTWACSSARCGTSTRSPRTAPPTACYEFLLAAAPLPVTGAVGAPSTRWR